MSRPAPFPLRTRAAHLPILGLVLAWLSAVAWSVDTIWVREPVAAVSFNARLWSEP